VTSTALVGAEAEDKYSTSKHDVEGLTKGERKRKLDDAACIFKLFVQILQTT